MNKKLLFTILFFIFSITFLFLLFGKIAYLDSFGDEQENLVAGWLISQGLVPYKDFFFHHAPLPFFLSSLFFPWAKANPELLRTVIFSLFLGAYSLLYWLVSRRFTFAVFLTFMLFALSAPMLSLHMFLADTIGTLSLLVIVAATLSYVLDRKPNLFILLLMYVIATWVAFWSSVTLLIPIGFMFLAVLLVTRKELFSLGKQKVLLLGALFSTLHLSFPIYFFIKGAFLDFYWSVFTYNTKYYFPLRLADGQGELQYGFVFRLINQFSLYLSRNAVSLFQAVYTFVLTLKTIILTAAFNLAPRNLSDHIGVALREFLNAFSSPELGSFTLLLLLFFSLILRKKFLWGFSLILFAFTLRVRDNGLFHLSPYYLVIFFFTSAMIYVAVQERQRITAVAFIATLVLAVNAFFPSYITSVSQKLPMIDCSLTPKAELVKQYTSKQNPLLLIGGNTAYYLLTDTMPSHKWFYFYPWFHGVPQIAEAMTENVAQKIPEAIIIEGYDGSSDSSSHYAPELIELVNQHYRYVGDGVYVR